MDDGVQVRSRRGGMREQDLSVYLPRRSRRAVSSWTAVLSRIVLTVGAAGLVALVVLASFHSPPTSSPVAGAPAPPLTTRPQSGAVASTGESAGARPTSVASSAAVAVRRADPAWVARTASQTGIPARALAAYASADLTVAAEQPRCRIAWNTIAAIGSVESSHASEGGAVLTASGATDIPIRGPVLNGDGVAAIKDTDGGAWDGDSLWDRAVGPMQFIPSTWRDWAADGNGDGVADPNQIDDAALAAARYLCASGPMDTPAGWRAAVFSYNHSDAYVNNVATTANQYAAVAR